MSNNNWYETSDDMLMPLPLTMEQVNETVDEMTLTEEMTDDMARRRLPILPLFPSSPASLYMAISVS